MWILAKKKLAVPHALLSKRTLTNLCLCLIAIQPCNILLAKNKSIFIDQALFLAKEKEPGPTDNKPAKPEAQCIRLSRGPGVDLETANPGLHQLLTKLMQHLNKRESKNFQKLFHPRAKVEHDFGERVFSILGHRYDKPWIFSVFRVWAILHPEKQRVSISCEDEAEYTINSRYGYERQYGVWLQIMGQNELGRIFLAISPVNDQLWITGFHIQQWTHLGHDWEYWTLQGNKALEEKDRLKAYVHYDVAQKLLVGGDFINHIARDEIINQRNQLYTPEKLIAEIQEALKDNKIVYAATILSRDGTGLLVREMLSKIPSTHDLQKRCHQFGKTLYEKARLKGDGGVRCSFIVPGEAIDKEGQLGGFYLSQQDLGIETK